MRKPFVVALLVVALGATLILSAQLRKSQRDLLRAEKVIAIQEIAIMHHIAVERRYERAHPPALNGRGGRKLDCGKSGRGGAR